MGLRARERLGDGVPKVLCMKLLANRKTLLNIDAHH